MENNLDIKIFSPEIWAESCAKIIQSTIDDVILKKGNCSILLPGGKSAKLLFAAWRKLPEFRLVSCLNIYFCDERCVDPESDDSNYKTLLSILFNNTLPNGIKINRIQGEFFNKEVASQNYADILPDIIDIAVFGVGEDGHIASLFAGSEIFDERYKLVVPVLTAKSPLQRITITSLVIDRVQKIFTLVYGNSKKNILLKVLYDTHNFKNYPARLLIKSVWLVDSHIIVPKIKG